MLVCMCESKFFTSLDLSSGYYHLKLSPETRRKGEFTTIFGKHNFLIMLIGLAQGPAYFTTLMQKVFGQFSDFCSFHFYDVLVHYSNE